MLALVVTLHTCVCRYLAVNFRSTVTWESFGGGWNLIYSSRDNSTRRNNMQKGDRSTAHILTLDSQNANKRLAYDVLKAIEASSVGYQEMMLTGYRNYTGT